MSLKILLVPSLIIGILIIAIGYIKPGVMTLFEKKTQFDQVVSQSEQLDAILSNAAALKGQLSAQSEDVEFLRGYLPGKSDVEIGVDQLNYLASKSGVAVKDMQVAEIKKEQVAQVEAVDAATSSADVLFAPTEATSSLPVSVKKTYTPLIYTITIQTIGSYDTVKSFLSNVMKSHRFIKVSAASVSLPGATADQQQPQPNGDVLESEFSVDFLVLPEVVLTTALGDATFDTAKLDFSPLDGIRLNQDGAIPDLPMVETGKANLFK